MANIKSQIKRIKTNAVRTERNRAYKSELRTWIRKFRAAAESGDAAAAQERWQEFWEADGTFVARIGHEVEIEDVMSLGDQAAHDR